uniref:Uncharacterized protein n=1 Tax=Kalanchoe fedtschenkoi TaxID=63787 RepID=A0A7N0U254_KALFE
MQLYGICCKLQHHTAQQWWKKIETQTPDVDESLKPLSIDQILVITLPELYGSSCQDVQTRKPEGGNDQNA